MGFIKSVLGIAKQRLTPPPPLPPAPTPVPTKQDPAVLKARQRERRQAALSAGRGSTVLTSGLGLTTEASSAKKSLLGK